MSKGDINSAIKKLATKGSITTTPTGAINRLKYNGTWESLSEALCDLITYSKEHPSLVTITHPDFRELTEKDIKPVKLDPKKYADVAVKFLLGDPEQTNIADFYGNYEERLPVICELGATICESICAINYKEESEPIVMYSAERTLYYRSSQPTFTIFGE